jgi:hypothetical protein
MHGTTLTLALLFVAPVVSLGAERPKYTTHKDAGAGYTATFPGEPRKSNKVLASAGGDLKIETQRVEYGGMIYSVTVTTYPDSIADVPAEKILDGVRDGMKGTDGKLLTETSISRDEVIGRDLLIEAGKKNSIRAEVFLSKRKLYQVMVTGPKDLVANPESEVFLRSFQWYK